jgi:hypothetical protein
LLAIFERQDVLEMGGATLKGMFRFFPFFEGDYF